MISNNVLFPLWGSPNMPISIKKSLLLIYFKISKLKPQN
jgi:hypothetical protein